MKVTGRSARELVVSVRQESEARALLVTNMWPGDRDKPVYGVFVKRQVDTLVAAGLRCDVLYMRGHRSPLAYLAACMRIAACNFRRRRYHLVHALAGEALPPARCYLRAPVVVTFRGSDLIGNPNEAGKVTVAWRMRRTTLRHLTRFTAASVTVSRQLEERLPKSIRGRNTVIPTGVDQARFSPMDREAARQALGWPVDERTILFAADISRPEKRYPLARQAAELAAQALPKVKLRIAAQDVPPEQMPVLMNGADCLLLTSALEGSPNVVKEALACNLPVVSTDVGDVRERLAGVEPSLICRADAAELAAALVSLLRTPRRSNGRERSSALSEQEVARSLLRVYARVTDARGPGSRRRPEMPRRHR